MKLSRHQLLICLAYKKHIHKALCSSCIWSWLWSAAPIRVWRKQCKSLDLNKPQLLAAWNRLMTTRIHQSEITCSSQPKDPVEHPNRDHPSRLALFHPFDGHDCLSFQTHLDASWVTLATLKCTRYFDYKMHGSFNTTETNSTRKCLQSNTIPGQADLPSKMFKLLHPSCWKISVQPNNHHAQQCDPLGKQCINRRDQAALRPLLWQSSWHATHQLLGTSPLEFTASFFITVYGCWFWPPWTGRSVNLCPTKAWNAQAPKPKLPSFWLRSSSLILQQEVMPCLSLGFAGRSTPANTGYVVPCQQDFWSTYRHLTRSTPEWDSRRPPSPGCQHCNTWHPTPWSLLPPRWRNPWGTGHRGTPPGTLKKSLVV